MNSANTIEPTASTPLMQQYQDLKKQHPDKLLFFRLGDFYELFSEDAQTASPILEVVLTQRHGTPMCGVPAHALESYLAKALRAGFRVAIAEQLEDPSQTKGIVKRGITRIITPGTLQEDTLLEARVANYLVAIAQQETRWGLCALEHSTGELLVTELANERELKDELLRLAPSEVICPKRLQQDPINELLASHQLFVSFVSENLSLTQAEAVLKKRLNVESLRAFGLSSESPAMIAAALAIGYAETNACGKPQLLQPLKRYSTEDYLTLDTQTIAHLDLLPPTARERQSPSLLGVIDHTRTAMGARLLRQWLLHPLRQLKDIQMRQERVTWFIEHPDVCLRIRESLKGITDLERILSRISSRMASPREVASLAKILQAYPEIKSWLSGLTGYETLQCETLANTLSNALCDEPPTKLSEGGIFRTGFHTELDELQQWVMNGKSNLLTLEKEERERTGIPSLKVGFNNIYGYYIEVTKTHQAKVPPHYHRKQTMVNAERFITPELKEFETKILGAEERLQRLEQTLFESLLSEILTQAEQLQQMATQLSEWDVLSNLAHIAQSQGYCRPEMNEGTTLQIVEGFHPVLQQVLKNVVLVPNDLTLNTEDRQILILTGPNMSGKSTYLRQTALITLLAQMGSYVPAKSAQIGVVDRIFTRIGASDRLSEGESTFMVEMVETAHILHHATERSLVILDEVGRGTSTYDGMAIAWAVIEYLKRPKVLFATHYFELTDLEHQMKGIRNAHVAVREWKGQVIFLHKVESGPADRSYGIHVAQIAGMPNVVVERAKTLLKMLESEPIEKSKRSKSQPFLPFHEAPIDEKRTPEKSQIEKELETLSINQMTPLDAFNKLVEWQKRLNTKG